MNQEVPVFATAAQGAQRFHVCKSTFWRWRATDPSFPRPIRLSSKTVRWRVSDLDAWAASRSANNGETLQ